MLVAADFLEIAGQAIGELPGCGDGVVFILRSLFTQGGGHLLGDVREDVRLLHVSNGAFDDLRPQCRVHRGRCDGRRLVATRNEWGRRERGNKEERESPMTSRHAADASMPLTEGMNRGTEHVST